jgi:hypothetical protein
MQHQSRANAMARRAHFWSLAAEACAVLSPPRVPRAARGLSGRPTCLIYARGNVWILEFDSPTGGWLDDGGIGTRRLTFSSLAAAIGYAERYGLDYRIEPPRRSVKRNTRSSKRLPRSWLARLARNGRKGAIYHG